MFEGTESEERRESGTEEMAQEDRPNSGGGISGQGGEGSGAAAATPEIGEDGEVGQTQVPAERTSRVGGTRRARGRGAARAWLLCRMAGERPAPSCFVLVERHEAGTLPHHR
jgi:hypothetical protein